MTVPSILVNFLFVSVQYSISLGFVNVNVNELAELVVSFWA